VAAGLALDNARLGNREKALQWLAAGLAGPAE